MFAPAGRPTLMEEPVTKPDALLLYSGGIDSVQALYARAKSGLPTRVHHVQLRNWEGRAPLEKRATQATLAFIERKFPGMVTYTESGFDYGDLRYVVRDHNIWGLVAGIVLANPKEAHVSQVIRTFHRDSVKGGLESPAGQAAERGWRESIARMTASRDTPVELVYPQRHMTKGDIMAAMPKELLALCWYCRRPRGGQPCHECHACHQVDAVLAGRPLAPLDAPHAAPENDAPPADSGRPKKSASRATWAEHAASLNIVTEGLTKAEIITALDAV